MFVYRLSRKKYAHHLSGKGAALRGARWNSKGVQIIYTAENRSLAMAEVAVHLSLATMPTDYMMMRIKIPDVLKILNVSVEALPHRWNSFPYLRGIQDIGDDFIAENKFCLMRIPSVVTPGDFNILINPHHQDFSKIKIDDVSHFPFDQRLFK